MNIQFGHQQPMHQAAKERAKAQVARARETATRTVDYGKAIKQLADAVDILVKNA